MTTATIGADMAFARSLFTRGTDLLGATEIKQVFGLDLNIGEMLPMEFTTQDLVRARELDQMLVLQIHGPRMASVHEMTGNKASDGKPLFYNTDWYRNEPFFTSDPIRPGWRLVSRVPIPGSRDVNYLVQTEALVTYLRDSVYAGLTLPKVVVEAIAEFERERKALAKLLDSDWREAAKQLVALKVNQMFRETPAEVMWSLALYEGVNHERLLPPGSWTWTNRLSSGGGVVDVGNFDGRGAGVDGDGPGLRLDSLGVRFSRSVNLE